jgi:hypothetical protein
VVIYSASSAAFFAWCDERSLALTDLEPSIVAAYIEQLQQALNQYMQQYGQWSNSNLQAAAQAAQQAAQQQQQKKLRDMIAAIKKGDKVVTSGGIIGTGELTLLTSHAENFLIGTSAEHEGGNGWTFIRENWPAFNNYPDHVGGNFVGEEGEEEYANDDSLFINTVHFSTQDLSALKDGFSLQAGKGIAHTAAVLSVLGVAIVTISICRFAASARNRLHPRKVSPGDCHG